MSQQEDKIVVVSLQMPFSAFVIVRLKSQGLFLKGGTVHNSMLLPV